MKHLENFGEYDKEKMMSRFKEMKAKGGKFTLADIARDEQGNLPKINEDIPQSAINKYVNNIKVKTGKNLRQFFGDLDISDEIEKMIRKYHSKAIEIGKYEVSEVGAVHTSEGEAAGFTYGEYTIFFEDMTMLIESFEDEAHELAIYEIEEL